MRRGDYREVFEVKRLGFFQARVLAVSLVERGPVIDKQVCMIAACYFFSRPFSYSTIA